jgi:hypothetical protein
MVSGASGLLSTLAVADDSRLATLPINRGDALVGRNESNDTIASQ